MGMNECEENITYSTSWQCYKIVKTEESIQNQISQEKVPSTVHCTGDHQKKGKTTFFGFYLMIIFLETYIMRKCFSEKLIYRNTDLQYTTSMVLRNIRLSTLL